MKIKGHIEKANHIEATVQKLNPEDDQETIIWGLMHICSNWLNAALHAKGITEWYWDMNPTQFKVELLSHLEDAYTHNQSKLSEKARVVKGVIVATTFEVISLILALAFML